MYTHNRLCLSFRHPWRMICEHYLICFGHGKRDYSIFIDTFFLSHSPSWCIYSTVARNTKIWTHFSRSLWACRITRARDCHKRGKSCHRNFGNCLPNSRHLSIRVAIIAHTGMYTLTNPVHIHTSVHPCIGTFWYISMETEFVPERA